MTYSYVSVIEVLDLVRMEDTFDAYQYNMTFEIKSNIFCISQNQKFLIVPLGFYELYRFDTICLQTLKLGEENPRTDYRSDLENSTT